MNSKDNAVKQKNKKKRKPFRYFLYDFIKVTGALGAAVWLRPKRLFASKKAKAHIRGGAVVIANHTSVRDPIAMYFALWYRRVSILAIKELFKSKLGNWFFRGAGCIPVDREAFSMDTFHEAVEVLSCGGIVGIFPEGRINHDASTVEPFKSGAVLMAMRGRVPIVPVYIAPAKEWYRRTVMVIGEPIDPQEVCESATSLRAIDNVSQKLREKEIELKEIYESWKTKKSSK